MRKVKYQREINIIRSFMKKEDQSVDGIQDPIERLPQDCMLFHAAHLDRDYGPTGSRLHEFVGVDTKSPFAGGVVFWSDAEVPFTLWYDELLIAVAVEGIFEIQIDDKVMSLNQGDAIWIPAGTSLTYRSRGKTLAYYVVSPVDWRSRKPASGTV